MAKIPTVMILRTPKFFLVFILYASILGGCKKSPTCQLNDPAPAIQWSSSIYFPDERLTNCFMHGNELYYGVGLDNTQLVTVNTLDGNLQLSAAWQGLRNIDNFYEDGDYLYWN